jgi:hypothetical protein
MYPKKSSKTIYHNKPHKNENTNQQISSVNLHIIISANHHIIMGADPRKDELPGSS